MYVALAAILGVLAGAGIASFILAGPIPIWDRGFRIFVARDQIAQRVIVDLLSDFGLKPRFVIGKDRVKRILMDDGVTVISVTAPELLQEMGMPDAGLAVVVKDPTQAAEDAVVYLQAAGFEAEIPDIADPEVPEGAMVFVRTNAFTSTLLVFRKHFFKMGPRPPRWKD